MRVIKADCIALQSMLDGDGVGCGMGFTYILAAKEDDFWKRLLQHLAWTILGEISAGEQREGLFSHSSNIGGCR